MKVLLVCLLALFITSMANAWDFSGQGDLQISFTDNVNLTNENIQSDAYSTLSGYLQTQNNSYKFKLKSKLEKYKTHEENNYYSFDLSGQYKRTKNDDYTFAIFKQVYNGVPLVSTDTTSDNSGARLSASFSNDFSQDTSGYAIFNGTYRNYSKIINRKDKTVGASFGLEHYFNSNFLINPEFLMAVNNSTDSYYKNTFYGPSIFLSYTLDPVWEIFMDGSYSHTTYPERSIITSTGRRRASNAVSDEYQNLLTAEIGAIYTWEKKFPVQLKYSTNKNTSNNSSASYHAKILSVGIGAKF